MSKNKWDVPVSEKPFIQTRDLMKVAKRFAANGDTDGAIQLALELARRDENAECYVFLGNCYGKINRPIAALGYMLRGKHLGADLKGEEMAFVKSRVYELEHQHDFAVTCEDCYILGNELAKEPGMFFWAQALLQKAATNDPHGTYNLSLADLYATQGDHVEYRKRACQYYALAASRGNPEFLTAEAVRNSAVG